jgi:ABC-type transport system substrate-binding protein
MKIISLRSFLLAAGLTGACVSLASAQANNPAVVPVPDTATTSTIAIPGPVKPTMPALPTAIQTLIDKFSTNRDALIAAQQAVIAQLKAATPDQRKAIVAALQAQNKDLLAAQRKLAKEIRDELRQLRKLEKPSGG